MIDEGGGASRSTDPASGTSAATDVSLREVEAIVTSWMEKYLIAAIENSRRECREGIKNVEKSIEAARKNADENVKKALDSIDKRFDSVNEFRGALSDLSKDMATHNDVQNLAEKVVAADQALEQRFEALYQRNRQDIDKIASRLDRREGQDTGSTLTKGTLYTVVGLGLAALGLVITLVVIWANHAA